MVRMAASEIIIGPTVKPIQNNFITLGNYCVINKIRLPVVPPVISSPGPVAIQVNNISK